MTTELTPEHDARKSFHGKATVRTYGTTKTLYSYGVAVADIAPFEIPAVQLFAAWDYSPTTLRHVKEFLRQNGFKADTKTPIERDYA